MVIYIDIDETICHSPDVPDYTVSYPISKNIQKANKLYEEGATDLIKYLENAEYNETDMWKMLMHIKRRDRLRGTNLLKVFPEWKEYYETCNG